MERLRRRITELPKFGRYAAIPAGFAAWAALRWPWGLSLFGFESPYWDLGLLPIVTALMLGAICIKGTDGARRRFLIGFVVCGFVAAVAYVVSCSRPARWSLVSVLQPFQTGFMLAPEMRTTWTNLTLWGIVVDTVILVLLPLVPAALGGVVCSVRLTLRRVMVAIAVIAVCLAGIVSTIRRARQHDRMGHFHRSQIVGVLYSRAGPGAKLVVYHRAVDRNGKAVSSHQQRMDRWHEAMAQEYWHASYYPWSGAVKEIPLPE